MAGDIGLRRAIYGSHITFFTGSQPASANSTIGSSQPIITFTKADGVYTPEVKASWQAEFSSVSGTATITSITVGGIELLSGEVSGDNITDIASSAAESINENVLNLNFTAFSSLGVLTVQAPKATGTKLNGLNLVVATSGTINTAYNDSPSNNGSPFVDGVDHENGLEFTYPQDGAGLSPAESVFYIEKPSGDVWSGLNGYGPATATKTALFAGITNGQTYTAGWGRICVDAGDTGFDATSGLDGYVRVDFSVGTSGADCIMLPSTSFLVNTALGNEIQSVINSFRLKLKKNMTT